ncbi:hypothetical protein [Sagittula stellata]|uniref:Uncharacterized protein n=1 Tax=Sagittula stellata (strain ATCC 700073 / DSM 11524 / E-37) TaxID=388399 RepID=A3K568_SAGS3|nr:hypothetical protein [Sagittula stellata]EBA07669.1 hypothetical protein SSE37_13823 [Sagittula stellata E-37]
MRLKFVTSIVAVGALIAALSTASPAAARNNDTARVLFGTAATLLLLNELAKQNNKGHKPRAYVQTDRSPRYDRGHRDRRYDRGPRRHHGYGHHRHGGRHQWDRRHNRH